MNAQMKRTIERFTKCFHNFANMHGEGEWDADDKMYKWEIYFQADGDVYRLFIYWKCKDDKYEFDYLLLQDDDEYDKVKKRNKHTADAFAVVDKLTETLLIMVEQDKDYVEPVEDYYNKFYEDNT